MPPSPHHDPTAAAPASPFAPASVPTPASAPASAFASGTAPASAQAFTPGAETPALAASPALPVAGRDFGNAQASLEASLRPETGRAGSGWVAFDLPGVAVGTAEYDAGPTGATVVSLPPRARTAVDRRGGAAGLLGAFPVNDAICLAGGSTFGLAAATGVLDEMLRRSGHRTDFAALPVVSGAVVYDFAQRDNAVYPDAELGRAALTSARTDLVAVGRVGAGVSATVGKAVDTRAEYARQGAAFTTIGPAKVLVLTIVNAIGVIVDRAGVVRRGNLDPATGERHPTYPDYAARITPGAVSPPSTTGNTTLTVVVTNVRMDDFELTQFATQVHSSMHRAIQPFHTIADGDTLFAATTDEVTVATPSLAVGAVASELAWDAVLSTT
ncbi:P1 family peptidase [Actinoplanes sp. CA-131856]